MASRAGFGTRALVSLNLDTREATLALPVCGTVIG